MSPINGDNDSQFAVKDSALEKTFETAGENGHKIAFDPRDISESAARSKQPLLTLMEEVLLLGLKDKQVAFLPALILLLRPETRLGKS